MKKVFCLLLLIATTATVSLGQTEFLNRVKTKHTGVKGKVTFEPQATLKISGHDDYSNKITAGSTFKLLNLKMVKDDIGLYTIKIKVVKDMGNPKNNGKIGYMYPASTTLTDYTNYNQELIVNGPKKW